MGREQVPVLHGIDLTIADGEMVAIMGPLGSAKSTLMNILGCLDMPSDGWSLLDGADVSKLGKKQLARVRSLKIGFVFQSFQPDPGDRRAVRCGAAVDLCGQAGAAEEGTRGVGAGGAGRPDPSRAE